MTDDVPCEGERGERYPRRAIGMLLLTVALGPPVGSLVVLGPFLLSSQSASLADFFSRIAGIAFAGYIAGGVRAGLAGAWMAYRVWLTGRIGYLECAAAALAATVIGTLYLMAKIGPDGWPTVFIVSGFLCVAALVAAVVCRWVTGAAGLLPREPRPWFRPVSRAMATAISRRTRSRNLP